jgi:hypothetical protein
MARTPTSNSISKDDPFRHAAPPSEKAAFTTGYKAPDADVTAYNKQFGFNEPGIVGISHLTLSGERLQAKGGNDPKTSNLARPNIPAAQTQTLSNARGNTEGLADAGNAPVSKTTLDARSANVNTNANAVDASGY